MHVGNTHATYQCTLHPTDCDDHASETKVCYNTAVYLFIITCYNCIHIYHYMYQISVLISQVKQKSVNITTIHHYMHQFLVLILPVKQLSVLLQLCIIAHTNT